MLREAVDEKKESYGARPRAFFQLDINNQKHSGVI